MIVIPMAGLSSRFFNAGYKLPKYMLELNEKSVFYHSVNSFQRYFKEDHFVFIIRDVYGTYSFIKSEIDKLGIKSFDIITLDCETRGQAETVILGLDAYSGNEELIIFNIDTFRPNFIKADFNRSSSGYLETFIGAGKNWSNVLPLSLVEQTVAVTAEKEEISNYCCTGVYVFSCLDDLRNAYQTAVNEPSLIHNGEFYLAPLYNCLIKKGFVINYTVIDTDDVVFCGTPSEYVALGGASHD